MGKTLSKKRRQSDNRKGVALITAVVASLVAVGVVYYTLRTGQRALDAETNCPKDGPDEITAVILDVTDALGPIQKADLSAFMEEIKAEIPKFGRLDLYTVGKVTDHPLRAEYVGCNPGSGRDISSELTGNRTLADRKWTQSFSARVDAVLARIELAQADDVSPIFESIQSVSVSSFEGTSESHAKKRLILVSDLIQFTSKISFYKNVPDFGTFRQSMYYRQVHTELSATDVTISIIPRETHRNIQNAKLRDFWLAYFTDQGASVTSWRPIKGAAP